MIFMTWSGVGFEIMLMGLSEWKDSYLGWDKEGQCIMICWILGSGGRMGMCWEVF